MIDSQLEGCVERGESQLHYAVSGRNHAPTLLLLHPLGSHSDIWAPQLSQFERFYRVIRFDARGHGRSTLAVGPPATRTLVDLCDDALAVLDLLKVRRAHWCGLSMGAMVALQAAVSVPERVQSLILANTAAYLAPAVMWDDRITIALTQGMDALVGPIAQRWFTPEFRANSASLVTKTLAQVSATKVRGYVEACAAIRDMDLRMSLTAIQAPTLIIAGAQDPSMPLEHSELLLQGIVGADLLVLDAAHLSNLEQPEDFTTAVINFLRD